MVIILTCAGIVVLVKTGKESTAKVPKPQRRVAVEVREMVPRSFNKGVEAYATISPLRKGTVSARISGPITRLAPEAEPGNSVHRGKELAWIEDVRYRIALDKAKATKAKFEALLEIERSENEKREALHRIAKQRLELSQSEYERKQALYKEKLIAKQALELAESQMELQRSEFERALSELRKRKFRIRSNQADIASAEAEIKRLKEDLSDTVVRAPFDGVIGERVVEVGDQVVPNQRLFTVLDVSTVKVIACIPSEEISRMKPGSSVQITTSAYPDMMFKGRVTYIHPEADPRNRTFSVEVHAKNEKVPMLLPGMFSRVRIPVLTLQAALMVPRDVLLEDERGSHVYVADTSERVARRRDVVVGDRGQEEAIILSGLTPGDVLIVRGQELLHEGAAIQWEEDGLEVFEGRPREAEEQAKDRGK